MPSVANPRFDRAADTVYATSRTMMRIILLCGGCVFAMLLGAATGRARRRRVVGLYLCGARCSRFEVDGAVGRYHLGDGELERLDAFASDGGDGVERKLAALGHGGEFFEFFWNNKVQSRGDEGGV